MNKQEVENNLSNAKKSIGRTSLKKNSKKEPPQKESLAQRLSRLAEERASEALYAEQYREKLSAKIPESEEKTEDAVTQSEQATEQGTAEVLPEQSNENCAESIGGKDGCDERENTEPTDSVTEPLNSDTEAQDEEDTSPDKTVSYDAEAQYEPSEDIMPNGYILVPVGYEPPTVDFFDEYIPDEDYNVGKDTFDVGYDSPFEFDNLPNVAMSGYTDATMEREYFAPADIRPPRYSAETEADIDDYAIDFEGYRINEDYVDAEKEPGTSHVFDEFPEEFMYPEFSDIDERESAREEEVRFFVDDIEENVRLVELRMLYEAEMLKNRHKMLKYKFSMNESEIYLSRREAEREVNKRLSKITAAKKYERSANRRYYLAAEDRCIGKTKKRAKNAALIASINRRLDFLLTERAVLNRRLTELYTGSVIDAKTPIRDKNRQKAIVKARKVYKSQRPLAKHVMKLKAPELLREKIIALMNEKTEAYANIEYLERRLKKERISRGARKSIKREIKQEKKKIRYANYDIKMFVKRAEKHNTIFYENGKQLAWIFSIMALIAVGIGVYLAYGDAIFKFFSSLF